MKTARLIRAVTIAVLLAATVATAQDFYGRQRYYGYGRRGMPPRFPTATSFDGRFNFCRLMYQSQRREAGGSGWTTDYPDADINFSIRLSELTKTHISKQSTGDPNHLVVRLTDPFLFQCPFLSATDVGTILMSDAEAENLRAYLDKGGFLWVDDFWGPYAWETWVDQISRVLPSAQFPIRDLAQEHPINRTLFEVEELPQIPSIAFWRQSGGGTSERGEDSAEPHLRAIIDAHGRIMVLMTHNTDISDAWEREGEDPRFFFSFSPNGYAVGLNTVVYAMSH
ncbi:MAG: DUF4159 domain-containing protein [Vicinamibacterales bacterium]